MWHSLANPSHRTRVIIQVMRRGPGVATGLALCALFVTTLTAAAAASESTAAPIKVRLSLVQTRVVAGQRIKGSVVLTNTTNRVITVNTCAADGWLEVGLSGRVNSLPFGSLMMACPPSLRLRPGLNRFGVTVITTYAGCTQPQPDGSSSATPLMPWCTVAGQPPLPAGRYVTKVHLVGLTGLTSFPNQVVVHLTSPTNPPPVAPCADQPGIPQPSVSVPNVVGMNSLAAASLLAKVCLNAGYTSPVGSSVISESPAAGSNVPEHATVTLSTR
jgi:PASTA domain